MTQQLHNVEDRGRRVSNFPPAIDSQRKIRRRVGMKATVELLLALIISRLDCRNSLLAGVPQSTLNPL